MNRTCGSFLVVLLLLVGLGPFSVSAQSASESSVQFEVSEPPSGPLDQDRLSGIAATIRRLEQHPMAQGADEARATLVQWLQTSPDASVSICPEIAAPFANPESPSHQRALQQHLLSTAAYEIEHPDAKDPVAAKLSGIEGALRVYENSRVRQRKSRSSQQEAVQEGRGPAVLQLLQMREEGTLEEYINRGVKACQGQ
jgi:hypothetical protein